MTSMSSTWTDRGRALVAALLTLSLTGAAQLTASGTVEAVVREVLAVLRDGALDMKTKQDKVEAIAEENFDFDLISKLVLGRSWRKLSEEQRAEFQVEFKRHLSLSYGRQIDAYSDEQVDVVGNQSHSNGDVTVKTQIVGGGADGATVNYRMRERDDRWYAIDVIIEGVSMISNFRSQIQGIMSNRGPEHLIQTLREKNDEKAKAEPEAETS